MTRAFDLRFDESDMSLPDMIEGLGGVLADQRIVPHSVSSLVPSNGRPSVDFNRRIDIPIEEGDLRPTTRQVASWWGANIYCISLPLAERLGRGDAMEVDFVIYQTPSGKRTLQYKESSRAYDVRLHDEDAQNELYGLQLALCSAFSFLISDYDEESSRFARHSFATLHEAESIIERAVQDGVGTSAVISQSVIGLPRAQELAGIRSRDVKFAAKGYWLFRLLHNRR